MVNRLSVDIWGPRQGKTTARVIPAVTAAPGAVFVTSNKRDVVDATRGVREKTGPVWIFDPQNIVNENPTWWWNPLSYITTEIEAAELAAVFFTVSQGPDARTDSYFTPAGVNLLTNALFAAALARRPLTQVYRWLTQPTEREPAQILREHGFSLNAESVLEIVSAPEKQRAGVYGTAKTVMNFLTNTAAMRWCTPQPGDDQPGGRPHFSPAEFVRGSGTLYCISKEGKGSTAGLVTAMTAAVADAAEKWGQQNPGGRVPVPVTLVLDEAANVCRWSELPNLYSHFGSRGIIVMTILQSWAQGVDVWGREGMTKLWGAATIKVVGSGVGGADFLHDISTLIGDYQAPQTSRSTAPRQGNSYTHTRQREPIMDVADIAAMPKGRAIVMAAGARPVLCRTLPWMTGQLAPQIQHSITRFDPHAAATPLDESPPAPASPRPADPVGE